MSNTQLYFIGYLVVILGLAIGGYLLGVPPIWLAVGALILLGFGIMATVSKSRSSPPPSRSRPQARPIGSHYPNGRNTDTRA